MQLTDKIIKNILDKNNKINPYYSRFDCNLWILRDKMCRTIRFDNLYFHPYFPVIKPQLMYYIPGI